MIKCDGGFKMGDFKCPSKFEGDVPYGTVSYSIIMHLSHQYCNMECKYCICDTAPAGFDPYSKFESDFPKMISLIKETDLKRGTTNKKHHWELWGGEPLFNGKAFKEVVEVLRKEWPDSTFSTSTNGLILGNDKVVEYLISNNIHFQLSHDGLGEKERSGNRDPFDNEHTSENIKLLAQKGLLTTINCTLSNYNYSFFDNIDYWNKKRKEWGIFDKYINIKLNVPYDADYDFNFAFTDKDILRKHCNEFVSLYTMLLTTNTKELLPYRKYILDLIPRNMEKGSKSSCRAYQAYKHFGEGSQDWNFAITTVGTYSECDLAEEVENPGGKQPEHCMDCEWKEYGGCNHCGALKYPKECIYQKAMMETYSLCQDIKRRIDNGKKCNDSIIKRNIKQQRITLGL